MLATDSIQRYGLRDRTRTSARNILFKLYEYLGSPPADKFYPVKLNEIIKSVLNWNLEEVSSIGFTKYGEIIIGKIDSENKLISINVDATFEPERNYTLAHEIGHLVLHYTSLSCSSGSVLRKRSVRKIKLENRDPAIQKLEREANVFASELLMPEKAVRTHFHTIFEREKVRAGSTFVEKLCSDSERTRRRSQIEL